MNNIEFVRSSKKGDALLEVRLESETLWLTLNQIADLFNRDKSVISRHLQNIFKSKELLKKSVVAKNATTAKDGKTYQIEYYNLDAILSVGYRVNSKKGTQFRIWANKVLKDHLLKGYSINEKQLQQEQNKLNELIETVKLITKTGTSKTLQLNEAKGLLDLITQYTRSFVLLNQFDAQKLEISHVKQPVPYEISYKEACHEIEKLKQILISKKEASNLFENKKMKAFREYYKPFYKHLTENTCIQA